MVKIYVLYIYNPKRLRNKEIRILQLPLALMGAIDMLRCHSL